METASQHMDCGTPSLWPLESLSQHVHVVTSQKRELEEWASWAPFSWALRKRSSVTSLGGHNFEGKEMKWEFLLLSSLLIRRAAQLSWHVAALGARVSGHLMSPWGSSPRPHRPGDVPAPGERCLGPARPRSCQGSLSYTCGNNVSSAQWKSDRLLSRRQLQWRVGGRGQP